MLVKIDLKVWTSLYQIPFYEPPQSSCLTYWHLRNNVPPTSLGPNHPTTICAQLLLQIPIMLLALDHKCSHLHPHALSCQNNVIGWSHMTSEGILPVQNFGSSISECFLNISLSFPGYKALIWVCTTCPNDMQFCCKSTEILMAKVLKCRGSPINDVIKISQEMHISALFWSWLSRDNKEHWCWV